MNFESTFANPMGRIGRGPFIAALVVLLAVVAFYVFLVHAGRNGEWVLITLIYPGFVLLARRLHDMGKSAWLLLLPLALFAAGVWLYMFTTNTQLGGQLVLGGLGVSAVLALWGLIGKGQPDANKFGAAA
jgi:uncharacterized membrane protein YhaH (DUF805 family)